MSYYGQKTLPNFGKEIFPKLNPSDIKHIPIVKADQIYQVKVSNLVSQILDAKRINPAADTSTLEAEIDLIVYHLYNLTHAEVLLIDPQFPLSESEYATAGKKMAIS